MKIALVGATGNIGREITRQALARGHQVTAIVRRKTDLPGELDGAQLAVAALDDTDALAAAIAGHDVLASAFGPRPGDDPSTVTTVTADLVKAARQAGVPRFLMVGGAGTLEVAPGVQLVDTEGFPDAYKPVALAAREAFTLLQKVDDLDWTFYSPAAEIGPGPQKGGFRTQAKQFLVGADGHSRISYADYADAFVSEIESPQYVKQVATVAY
ncbi:MULTISPECIES: NAD(P)H-binding protein [Stenotrophomonas]|uniref:NAD(P)-dependent oxidoreductase n=1 Tax=Stenotrophomonas TaxID=40323 RepID=UPI000872739B|nr:MULTISPECIES: NAD(P)H-binding protein [Stenotrophomonas]OEY99630.1 3-beta hydroxysteroid dehydrogenase [Stenotrophomonas sp. BIIR7]